LHTELDISATYLTYMQKQVRSSNTKITTMVGRSSEPDEKPAPKPAAKNSALKKPAGKAVKKAHTKK
jgi:hypothetical protein